MTTPRTAHPFGALLHSETVQLRRSPGAVLWVAAAPIAAFVVLGSLPSVSDPSKSLHGISYLDAYLPILMLFSICMALVNVLPPTLATYREKGILRRLATTPVGAARMLAAQAVVYLVVSAVVAIVLLVLAVTAFGVSVPSQLPGFAVSLVLVAAACLGIGLLVAGLAPSAKSANAASAVLFFPLMFLAGLWVPRGLMPGWLRTISDWSPLGAGVRSLQSSIAGHWPPAQGLLVLAGYAVVLCLLAGRSFRWE